MLASFWFWPLAFIILAMYLAAAVPEFARNLPMGDQGPLRDVAAGAQVYAVTILTTTAAANITILTFVFSTLMVVLQLASSQLSPRILRPTLREGRAQISTGIMAGGFVFSICSLLSIVGETEVWAAAGTVLVAIGWTILIVLTFLDFVGYTISRIRAPAVIRAVARETARGIKRMYGWRQPNVVTTELDFDTTRLLMSPRDGVVTGLGVRDLARWAKRLNARVEFDVGLGDYVSENTPIGRLHGGPAGLPAGAALRFMVIEDERTLRGDPPYGFRLLIDIACRSLSPAINDPTTAVQVIDELQSLLVLLSARPEEPGSIHDDEGVLRVQAPTMSWSSYLQLAVQEIYEFGRGSSQVTQRLARMLDGLAAVVPETKADAVRELRDKIVVVPPMLGKART